MQKKPTRVDTQLLLLHYEMGGQGRGGREKLGNMKQIQRTTKIIGLTKKIKVSQCLIKPSRCLKPSSSF